MEQWWNDTHRGKLKYWEKTLYSLFGTWLDMELYWNDNDIWKLKYQEKDILHRGW